MNKVTTKYLKIMKEKGEKIAALTCYSYSMARIMVDTDIDVMLVGDSLGMVELGYENTIPVTIDEMVHHTKAVKKAGPQALLVSDMPFMSFNISDNETLRDASRLLKEGGAEAVKIEGGKTIVETAKFLIDNNIPVMGHLGLMPQSVHKMGGYKVQGKEAAQAQELLEDAKSLQEAGVFSIVLEGIPRDLAKTITESIDIPTIGIGAGPDCDGQILVINDMLGLDMEFKPKFVRRYAELETSIRKAFETYSDDVKETKFPSEEESYQ